MTPAEIEKEAERITFSVKYEPEMEDEAMKCFILEKLRAVHDAAIEKAASIEGDGRHCCEDCPCSSKAEEIRDLKLSSEAGGGQ